MSTSNPSSRRTEQLIIRVIAGASLLAVTGMAAGRVMNNASRDGLVRDYVASESVARIRLEGSPIPGAMLIRDFDGSPTDLYLLDAMAPRVIRLHPDVGGKWREVGTFGRRGGGPGEFLEPSGLALADSGRHVIVVDQNRLHYFGIDGVYLETRTPRLPCALLHTRVDASDTGVMLSGRCMRGDTVSAELFHVDARETPRHVASDALYRMGDGMVFTAKSFYSPGSPHGLFGGGTADCIKRVYTRGVNPVADSVCNISPDRYAFVPTARFKAKTDAVAAARPDMKGMFATPEQLPVYLERIVLDGNGLLLRPYSNDSLAFRRMGSSEDLVVAPVEGLVGCRPIGCLWMNQDDVSTMTFTSAARLAAAAGIGKPGGGR